MHAQKSGKSGHLVSLMGIGRESLKRLVVLSYRKKENGNDDGEKPRKPQKGACKTGRRTDRTHD